MQGPAAAGLGAVQQFFEALGLTPPPKVELSETAIALRANAGDSVIAEGPLVGVQQGPAGRPKGGKEARRVRRERYAIHDIHCPDTGADVDRHWRMEIEAAQPDVGYRKLVQQVGQERPRIPSTLK